MAKQNRSWEFDLEEGLLDSSRLTRVVIDPYNSELIKFAILPKKIPIGDTNATTSRYSKTLSLFVLANIILAMIIPKTPP